MKSFELPKFERKDLSELTGSTIGKVLKGAGIDLEQIVPICLAMHGALQQLNEKLSAIEDFMRRSGARTEAELSELHMDAEELREIVRAVVPGAGAEMLEASKHRPDATIAGIPVSEFAPLPAPANGVDDGRDSNGPG